MYTTYDKAGFSLSHFLVLLVNHEVFAGLFLFGAQISGCHSATLRLHVAGPRWEAWKPDMFPMTLAFFF